MHNNYNFSVKDLPVKERPREKLLSEGPDALSDTELIAVILRTGTKGKSVLEFSNNLLGYFKNLEYLVDASKEDLLDIKGLGKAKVSELIACLEIARRYNGIKIDKIKRRISSESISGPEDIVSIIRHNVEDPLKEHFFVLSFDVRNKLIEIDLISKGTLTASLVHPRETFGIAIKRHAASVIVAHNHPSGNVEPSEEDIKITKRLFDAGKLLGIDLLDHIIVTENDFVSLKLKGIIQ